MLIDHFGDYELIQKLGRGDMGIVYKTRHLDRKLGEFTADLKA